MNRITDELSENQKLIKEIILTENKENLFTVTSLTDELSNFYDSPSKYASLYGSVLAVTQDRSVAQLFGSGVRYFHVVLELRSDDLLVANSLVGGRFSSYVEQIGEQLDANSGELAIVHVQRYAGDPLATSTALLDLVSTKHLRVIAGGGVKAPPIASITVRTVVASNRRLLLILPISDGVDDGDYKFNDKEIVFADQMQQFVTFKAMYIPKLVINKYAYVSDFAVATKLILRNSTIRNEYKDNAYYKRLMDVYKIRDNIFDLIKKRTIENSNSYIVKQQNKQKQWIISMNYINEEICTYIIKLNSKDMVT